MNCEQCRERLHDYLDKVLEAAERAHVSEHVAACEACQRELDELGKLASLVGSLEELPTPTGFLHGVRERVDRPTVWDRLRGLLVRPRPSVSMAIPVIIVAFIAVFYVMTRPPRTAERAAQTPEKADTEYAYHRETDQLPRASAESTRGNEGSDLYAKDESEDGLRRAGGGEAAGEDQDVDRAGSLVERDASAEPDREQEHVLSKGMVGGGGGGGDNKLGASFEKASGRETETLGETEVKEKEAEEKARAEVEGEQREVEGPRNGLAVEEVGAEEDDVAVEFQVLDLGTDMKRIQRVAADQGGFVTEQRDKQQLKALVVNVPVKQFDKTVEQLQIENARNVRAIEEQNASQKQARQRVDQTNALLVIVRRIQKVLPGQ